MTETKKETFCHCFGCDQPILVGDSCHSITYSYDHIDSIMSVTPTNAQGLGSWCSACFHKMIKQGSEQLSLEILAPNI